MLNDITNELSQSRMERMSRISKRAITELVVDALRESNHAAWQGLQGIDAEHDGVTSEMWDQCLTACEMSGALVFGERVWTEMVLSNAEPVVYEMALRNVAHRVAKAIMVLNGYSH